MSEIACSFCRGIGKDPFGIMSWQSVCSVCGGRAVVDILRLYSTETETLYWKLDIRV